jgi:hypothetical protein
MGFKKFEKQGESFSPKISIWTNGTLGVSSGVFNTFELTGKSYCVLFFNSELNQVGIKFLASPSESGAAKISLRKSGGIIQAKTFFDCYKIDYSVSRQYILAFDDKERLFYFDLDLPFGDGEIPLHPHAIFVTIAAEALEQELSGLEFSPKDKAELIKLLFSIAAHKHLSLDRARKLVAKCRAAKTTPKDPTEVMLWKQLRK